MHSNQNSGVTPLDILLMVAAAGLAGDDADERSSESASGNGAARATAARNYETIWESLARQGAAPLWYRDAVFGSYFHWGIYSVPGFGGEKGGWILTPGIRLELSAQRLMTNPR